MPTTFDAHAPAERGSRHVLGCVLVSEAAACDVRMRVGRGAVTGGSKFVLHALRVLAAPMRTGATSSTGGGGGACDASLPTQVRGRVSVRVMG